MRSKRLPHKKVPKKISELLRKSLSFFIFQLDYGSIILKSSQKMKRLIKTIFYFVYE